MPYKAYYADYIYAASGAINNAWLLTCDDVVTGITTAEPGAEYGKVVYRNSGIFPALINMHTHAPMNLFRGVADDLPLDVWLKKHIWPLESKWLSPEFVKDAALAAACELIRGGTACICDMYFYVSEIASVFEGAGLRAVLGSGIIDMPTPHGKSTADYLDKTKALVEIYSDNKLIDISIAPHSVYTVSPDTYEKIVNFAVCNDILIQTHLAESVKENADTVSKYGKRPFDIMYEAGVFDCKSVLAHCVDLNDDEIDILGSKNANIAHCIQSNLKLGNGFAPVKKMADAGCNITVGTDSAASNNDLDLLKDMQFIALVHKGLSSDPSIFDSCMVLDMATKNAAKALHKLCLGTLHVGNQADFMVVSYDSAHMLPVYNPVSTLIYSAQKNDITDLFVAGRQLMKNRHLTTIDESDVAKRIKYWQDKINR